MKNMKSIIGAVAISGLALASSAATYTATLPHGTTNTLDEAFSNGCVAASEGEATPAGLYGASDFRITGGGRLEINVDLKTAGFAGEIHVEPGATLRITANGALGDTSHGTFVANGATLENECLDTSADSKLAFAGEPLTFAGAGVDGVGALVARTPSKQERNGVWGGTVLTMTGDAMISTVNGYQDFPNNSSINSLDMNGYTLTVRGIPSATGVWPGNVCLRPVVTNPGHIVLSNCYATMNEYANLGGGAENTLMIGVGCRFELYNATILNKKKWTLQIVKDAHSNPFQTSAGGGYWDGPIVLGSRTGDWNMSLQAQSVSSVITTNHSTLAGTISAASRLKYYNAAPTLPNPYLTLKSPDNVFAKGVDFSNVNLTLDADGALPSACGTAVVENASIDFNVSVASYALPVLCTSSNVTISDAQGSWDGIVKTAGSTLACSANSPAFTTLDLESGTMTLEEPSRNFNAGLYEGHKAYAYWYKDGSGLDPYKANAHCEGADNCNTNLITSTVRLAYEAYSPGEQALNEFGALVSADGYAFSYTGYIWNHDATNVTWTFAASERTVSRLYINYADVYGRQATGLSPENGVSADLRYGNATLHPGANHFWWRIGVSGKTVGPYSTVKSCTTWTDATKMGLVYDRLGRLSNDPANYERLVNSADGELFTLTDKATAEYTALREKTTARHLERLSGTSGAILNAVSRRLIVQELVGCPEVNTASDWLDEAGMTVTDSFTAQVTDLADGRHFTTDGKLIFDVGTTFELEGDVKPLKGAKTILATAANGIQGIPTVTGETALYFKVSKSADTKTLYLEYVSRGTMVTIL
ncbi:MAG TPA: hypothetical protein PKM57_18595 [Kiritimatiellia bacterium]|nr:hypothetical protein [Kiritimatiellia bacterium]HPS09545.1 hypothetical protein [Kiritimatiellia bacterium]